MSIKVRKGSGEVLPALVSSFNAWRKTEAVKGSYYHADVTSTTGGDFTAKAATAYLVSAATATNEGTTVTLTNDIKLKYNVHCADDVAHKVADTANDVTTDDAEDTDTAVDLLNELKAAYNLHIASTTYHYTADSTNDCSTNDATDLTSAETLANALKTKFNAHIVGAPGGSSIELIEP